MDLEDQAIILGYKRISFKKSWEIKPSPISVKELFQSAAHMARAEGNVAHAQALEIRLPELNEGFKYKVGRLKNGCATAYITNEGLRCRS